MTRSTLIGCRIGRPRGTWRGAWSDPWLRGHHMQIRATGHQRSGLRGPSSFHLGENPCSSSAKLHRVLREARLVVGGGIPKFWVRLLSFQDRNLPPHPRCPHWDSGSDPPPDVQDKGHTQGPSDSHSPRELQRFLSAVTACHTSDSTHQPL